jgi:hypothetical protein
MNDPFTKLQATLDACESWPCHYCFKFVAKSDELAPLLELFEGFPVSLRESSGGKYTSLTVQAEMQTSAEVLAVYRKVAEFPGVISL